jgi:hypothetical protein
MNTHDKARSDCTVDVVQIFKVSRHGETEKFQKVRFISNLSAQCKPKEQRVTNFQYIYAVCQYRKQDAFVAWFSVEQLGWNPFLR